MKAFCMACICALSILSALPFPVTAQSELEPHTTTLMRARVVAIEKEEMRAIAGTDVQNTFQTIQVEILDGTQKGKHVTVENDYLNMREGDVFYLSHTVEPFGVEYYSVNDPYRLPQLLFLTGLFVVTVLLFGGIQGLRGLMSLIASFFFIFYLLLPGIMHGYSPLLITVLVSSLIIVLGSYVTHGFTRTTSAAVIGMIATVSITGLLALWSVKITRLSGFGSDEAVYLNLNAGGGLDIVGLLLSGIIIGLLGVLYDAAIGQSVSVDELTRIAPHVSRRTIYERAVRIGREHIGALVNTLAIAYVGTSLPLLLLFLQSDSATPLQIINTEIFATEIVRIMIGSIGLVLAVPITTLVSVWMLVRPKIGASSEDMAHEHARLTEAAHTHTH
jgi:uncharacterized membrane protein